MKTDALFYRIAKEASGAVFELIGRTPADAARYRFDAIELKDTAARIDGLYVPIHPDDNEPVYFIEFQNHKSERVYSNLLLKVGLYLEKVNPRQNWQAVVIYPGRSVEQENCLPYRWLLNSEQMTRVYLDELPESSSESVGLGILKLIATKPTSALEKARRLIGQVRTAKLSAEDSAKLIELIEVVVLYQFPQKSRKELEKMLQVNDVRETRVFQEALEEGMEKGMEKGREEGKRIGAVEATEAFARRLLSKKFPPEEVAELTGLALTQIRKLKKSKGN